MDNLSFIFWIKAQPKLEWLQSTTLKGGANEQIKILIFNTLIQKTTTTKIIKDKKTALN